MRDTNVNTCWRKNAVDFGQHRLDVLGGTITADHCVKEAFIDDNVESSIFELHLPDVHLLEGKAGVSLLFCIAILLKLNGSITAVNADNVGKPIVIQLFS